MNTMTDRLATAIDGLDVDAWNRDGFLVVPGVIDPDQLNEVRSWTDNISTRPDRDGDLLQHYERTDRGVQIARSENLVANHDGFTALITTGFLPQMGTALIGEPVVIYKEKINYKLAGGAGFAPHQDARAYKFVDVHLTCMLAIDDSTEANGCLEFAAGMHRELLRDDGDGCIHPDVVAELDWRPCPVAAGDLVWFHSRVPHRSGANRSDTTRRALFCTYNAASQGDLRATYYADKISYLDELGAGSARVSTIGDFLGDSPTDDELRAAGIVR